MKQKNNLFVQIFGTYIGWLIICIILTIIFGIFSTHSTIIENGYLWCDYAVLICLMYPLGLTLVMFGYGIRNTYLSIKNRKK
jgi:hypothetical protein